MKKVLLYNFVIVVLSVLFVSCKDDSPIVRKDDVTIVSATYHATYKTFTITFSDGKTITVNAIIDNSVEPNTASATLDDGTVVYVTDANITGKARIGSKTSGKVDEVTQFVYDGMSTYYLWADEVVNKKPTSTDVDPEKYFYKILNDIDTKHGWSWITNNVNELLSDFGGEPVDAFGFQPLPLYNDSESNVIVGFVRYVYPNTPAAKAGLKRGDVITHANGVQLTDKNFGILYGANATTKFTVLDQDFENERYVIITPGKIKTDPVLYNKVYEIDGKKIGYLFYTSFTENYNPSLHKAFTEFKYAGVSDLVLDLRYNPGGGISAAIYLASLIAPIDVVRTKKAFTTMSYNNFLNKTFDSEKWDRSDYLGTYDKAYPDPVTANINNGDLNLYVITTRSTASASELLTFCLQPYMKVNQIGEKTSGKYTASWTLHAFNDFGGSVQPIYKDKSLSSVEKKKLENWAMQPIVGRYTDKDGKDFIATDGLIPNYPIAEADEYERDTRVWKPIGDVNDYLFAKAISLITGKPYELKPMKTRSVGMPKFRETNHFSRIETIYRNGVVIDNLNMIEPIDKGGN
ncbi:MAG: S41 family peptidase [Fermentimonas sp.]|jgi:carboxyl-terminal processing protease